MHSQIAAGDYSEYKIYQKAGTMSRPSALLRQEASVRATSMEYRGYTIRSKQPANRRSKLFVRFITRFLADICIKLIVEQRKRIRASHSLPIRGRHVLFTAFIADRDRRLVSVGNSTFYIYVMGSRDTQIFIIVDYASRHLSDTTEIYYVHGVFRI